MSDHAPLPTEQHLYPGQSELSVAELHARREKVFLFLSGIFLGTLAMLNILGISRFIDLTFTIPGVGLEIPMPLAVGVLPYPITFLCTDFMCELYGRRRANQVVWVGLVLNLWVVLILWLGGVLPPEVELGEDGLPDREAMDWAFWRVRQMTFGAVTASMIAYMFAQLVDVHLFHFWKKRTKGKHLWLRNNGSTLVSQLVDTTAVILITHFYARALPIDEEMALWPQLFTFIAAGYVFKVVVALVDTGPFYLGVRHLTRYLRLPPPGA